MIYNKWLFVDIKINYNTHKLDFAINPVLYPAFMKTSTVCFIWSSVWAALNYTLILAWPWINIYKILWEPLDNWMKLHRCFLWIILPKISFDYNFEYLAILASPIYTGAIGTESLPNILNPAFFINDLNNLVFFCKF